MRVILTSLIGICSVTSAFAADHYVRGYTTHNGTYVAPHHATNPDNTVNNNYGTQGNVNPYTGQAGTVPRQADQPYGTYNPGNNAGNSNAYGTDGDSQ